MTKYQLSVILVKNWIWTRWLFSLIGKACQLDLWHRLLCGMTLLCFGETVWNRQDIVATVQSHPRKEHLVTCLARQRSRNDCLSRIQTQIV